MQASLQTPEIRRRGSTRWKRWASQTAPGTSTRSGGATAALRALSSAFSRLRASWVGHEASHEGNQAHRLSSLGSEPHRASSVGHETSLLSSTGCEAHRASSFGHEARRLSSLGYDARRGSSEPLVYRGTSLTINRIPLGPYRRPMSRVQVGLQGGERFLMGEAPL